MFSELSNAIRSHLHPGILPVPDICRSRRPAFQDAAQAAMTDVPEYLPLADRIADPQRYRKLCTARRETLLNLLLSEPTKERTAHAADFITAICEEPGWNFEPVPSDGPVVDLPAAETALLLTVAVSRLGKQLEDAAPGLKSWIRDEILRRIQQPLLLDRRLRTNTQRPIITACDIILSILTLDPDTDRAERTVRSCLFLLDDTLRKSPCTLAPYADRVADSATLCLTAELLCNMTDGKADIRDQVPTDDILDELFYSWIRDDFFIDPANESSTPAVCGGELFLIGQAVGDEAIMALGARQHREHERTSVTILNRVCIPSRLDAISAFTKKAPMVQSGMPSDYRLMTARIPGLFCGMHIGGGRGNAGDLVLFAGGYSVFPGPNVPVLGGQQQWTPVTMPEGDYRVQGEHDIMSMNLAGAYPARIGLEIYQRTAILLRPEYTVRLVENLSFTNPQPVSFRYICAERPDIGAESARVGPITIRWEEHLVVTCERGDGATWMLGFSVPQAVRRGMFTFTFELKGY